MLMIIAEVTNRRKKARGESHCDALRERDGAQVNCCGLISTEEVDAAAVFSSSSSSSSSSYDSMGEGTSSSLPDSPSSPSSGNSKGSNRGDEGGKNGRGGRSSFFYIQEERLRLLRICERGKGEGGGEEGRSIGREGSTTKRKEEGERNGRGGEGVRHEEYKDY